MSARAVEAIFEEEPVPFVLTELGEWVASGMWVDTAEAAEILEMPRGSVADLALRGHIAGLRVGHGWLLDLDAVEVYLRDRRGRMGRPPSSARAAKQPAIQYMAVEPLLRLIDGRGGAAACGVVKSSADSKALERAKRSGRISARLADRLCVTLLGLTPWEVWGEAAL